MRSKKSTNICFAHKTSYFLPTYISLKAEYWPFLGIIEQIPQVSGGWNYILQEKDRVNPVDASMPLLPMHLFTPSWYSWCLGNWQPLGSHHSGENDGYNAAGQLLGHPSKMSTVGDYPVCKETLNRVWIYKWSKSTIPYECWFLHYFVDTSYLRVKKVLKETVVPLMWWGEQIQMLQCDLYPEASWICVTETACLECEGQVH